MEIKYEAVFGDQSLLAEAGTFTGLDVVVRNVATGLYHYCRHEDLTYDYLRKNPVVAMRRIIRTPIWTVEDQKEGKLPEVGAKVDGGKVVFVNSFNVITELESGAVIVSSPKTFLNTFKPIESPEEKAARLREEWCSNALDSASILSGMREYDLKRLGGYIGNIYDALLSGDLPVPVAPEQNK